MTMRRVLALVILGAMVLAGSAAMTGVSTQGTAGNTLALDTVNCGGVDIPSPTYSGVGWVVSHWEIADNAMCSGQGGHM